MNRTVLSLLLLLLVGCSTSDPGASRQISGQLSTQSMLMLDNPAIIVETGDGARRVARVARTGEFQILVPTNTSLHLGIATTLPSGALRETSTIVWPSRSTVVQPGTPIELGTVYRRGEDASVCGREGHSRDDDSDGSCPSPAAQRADLPYDARLPIGATFRLSNAFFEKGPAPAKILSVTMSGGDWRLVELKSDALFTVTQADCAHAGNRSTGRDRVEVTWQNNDGSTQTDHLDLRYCDGGTPPPSSAPVATAGASVPCESIEVCDGSDQAEHGCDRNDFEGVSSGGAVPRSGVCQTPVGTPPFPPPVIAGGAGAPCNVNADCVTTFGCFQSTCTSRLN